MSSFDTWKKSQSFPRAEYPFFLKNFKMAATRHVEVISELFDIYFNVLRHLYMILMLNSSLKVLVAFKVSLKNKSRMASIWGLIGSKSIVIRIWATYKL